MMLHDDPAEWSDAIDRLKPFEPPCPGFRGDEWRDVLASCKAFLEEHAARAHALGWTGLDLFGVHERVGATRVDVCGALMVSAGAKVTAVSSGVLTFENGRFLKAPAAERVLVWAWGKKA